MTGDVGKPASGSAAHARLGHRRGTSRWAEAPSPCTRVPGFARCVPATSVPRKSDHTQGKPLPAGIAAAIFPRLPAAGCGTVAGTDAERPTLQRVPRVECKMSVRKRTVLLGPRHV